MAVYYINQYIAGVIDFSSHLDESSFGTAQRLGEICIYEREGPVPHFHIRFKDRPDCCVKLNTNEYFSHGINKTKLNKNEREILDKFLSQDSTDDIDENGNPISIWESMKNIWNNCSLYKVTATSKPDYRIIR